MSATVCPARSVVGELAVDVSFAAGARGHRGDHLEHIRWTRRCAHGSNEHLDVAVELIHSFVELDVPAVQLSANHDTAFHAPKRSPCAAKSRVSLPKRPVFQTNCDLQPNSNRCPGAGTDFPRPPETRLPLQGSG